MAHASELLRTSSYWKSALDQVRNLRPGRSYGFRVVPLPVSEVFTDIPPQLPSESATFDTVPAPPAQPEPPLLVTRARNSLKVRIPASKLPSALGLDEPATGRQNLLLHALWLRNHTAVALETACTSSRFWLGNLSGIGVSLSTS